VSLQDVDVGVEWIGEIPQHWKLRKLRYSATIPNGQVDPRLPAYRELPLIAPNHIESNTGRLLEFASADDQGAESGKYKFNKGDVLYSKIRPELAKACLAPIDGLCSADMYPLHPAKDMDASFLSHTLISSGFTAYVVLASSRVAMPKVNRDELGDCHIPVPPLDEQRSIADFLDRKTALIDALIAKKQRQIDLMGEKRQALISQVVTKGLDPTVPMKDSGIPWLGKIPTQWDVIPLGFLINVQSGSTPSKDKPEFWDGEIPWVSPKDMKRWEISDSEDHISENALKSTSIQIIKPPAVLVVVRGMILLRDVPIAATTAPVTINQDMKALTTDSRVTPFYLTHYLRAIQPALFSLVEESGHGTRCLRTDLWRRLPVLVPPITQQGQITDFIDTECGRVDRVAGALNDQIDKLREYRQTLISAAVTGKIDVRAQEGGEA